MKFRTEINESMKKQGVIVFTLLLMALVALIIVIISLNSNSSILSNTDVIFEERVRPEFLSNLKPEPLERRIYILVCLLLPAISLLALLENKRYRENSNFTSIFGQKTIFSVILIIAAILSASIFIDIPYLKASLGMYPITIEQDRSFRLSTVIGSSVILLLLFRWLSRRPEVISGRAYWMCFFALLTIVPWRYFSEATMVRSPQWWGHADLIFYAIAQAALGKTIYVDVVSQYGFYPEFFSLLFRVLDPSVQAVGVGFLFLQALALFSVVLAVNKFIKNNCLFFITSLAVLGTCSSMPIYLAGYADAYLQYWPIRFLFPAVSIYLFSKYIELRNFGWGLVTGFVAALAPFWNIDTGIVVFGTWVFYNLNGAILRYRDRYLLHHHIINMVTAITFFLAILGCFTIYIFIKSNGEYLSYEYLLGYQRIFWRDGFFMLPLPLSPSV